MLSGPGAMTKITIVFHTLKILNCLDFIDHFRKLYYFSPFTSHFLAQWVKKIPRKENPSSYQCHFNSPIQPKHNTKQGNSSNNKEKMQLSTHIHVSINVFIQQAFIESLMHFRNCCFRHLRCSINDRNSYFYELPFQQQVKGGGSESRKQVISIMVKRKEV